MPLSSVFMQRFKTLAVHAGQAPDPAFGAVMTPIYQTSTFAFQGVGRPGPYDYSRSGNPTRKALETCLAALENGTAGFVFGTGMAAETTLLMLFKPGEHLIIHNDLYGGTYRLLALLAERGIEIEYVDLRDEAAVRAAVRPATRAIWIESPTNPCMNLVDLAAIAAMARAAGVLTICDNTFLSPYFQRPLDLGVDIVLHSTTKYINGHSDVVGGAIVVRDPALAERIGYLQNALGTCEAPFDCFLVLRGIKTLALRMEAHHDNALAIARWLEGHAAAFRLLGGVRVFTLAESLGGVESLIEHPATMTHASVPAGIRERMGITPDLIRISVGIEDAADLIADLDRAMDAAAV